MLKVAVLLTCHNRKDKTDICLSTFLSATKYIKSYIFDVFLVDDGSTDGTYELILEKYPMVFYIKGNGTLFWAGGMRLAWATALNSDIEYDGFLLINDDVEFIDSFEDKILLTQQWCINNNDKDGIYVLSTIDKMTNEVSYGGHLLKKRIFKHTTISIMPTEQPQPCDLANANILYVSSEVVKKLGILDSHFTHSLADFDYMLTANETGFPVLVCPGVGGYCKNDHPKDLIASISTIKERIKALYSPKGMAFNEYLYYLKKHFWWKAPYAFLALWKDVFFK